MVQIRISDVYTIYQKREKLTAETQTRKNVVVETA